MSRTLLHFGTVLSKRQNKRWNISNQLKKNPQNIVICFKLLFSSQISVPNCISIVFYIIFTLIHLFFIYKNVLALVNTVNKKS